MKQLLCAIAIMGAMLVTGLVGYLYGRQFGNLEAYMIGFEQGQNDGIATAQAAYESGGEIVNLKSGQRTSMEVTE